MQKIKLINTFKNKHQNKHWFIFVSNLYHRISNDDVSAVGAQITYYLLLSLFPLMIFIATLVSYSFITPQNALDYAIQYVPKTLSPLLLKIFKEILEQRSEALLPISMIITLWFASGGVSAISNGLNKAYDQKMNRTFFKGIFVSLILTLVTAIGFILSLIALVFGEAFGRHILKIAGYTTADTLWDILRYAVSFLSLFILLLLLYRFAPNKNICVKGCIPGALFSTIAWFVVSLGFSLYVSNFTNFSYTYGSIGGIVALMIWLYWSSIVILVGGEINASLFYMKNKVHQ